jgi:rubredoxin
MTIQIIPNIIRYTCSICGKIFEKEEPKRIQCLVMHPPGTCCHLHEKEIHA